MSKATHYKTAPEDRISVQQKMAYAAGMALAGLLTGLMLHASGFDVALGADQTENTLFLLRIFDVGIPIITSAIALWIIASYSINEERAHEIRTELERRRGKTNE